jgi:hypothetical protein
MNPEQPEAEQPNEAQGTEQRPQDPRRRLRELLAIPERDRSDAVWDEIIALEIDLAPGNRASAPNADGGRRNDLGRPQQPASGPKQGGRPFKKQRRRGGR